MRSASHQANQRVQSSGPCAECGGSSGILLAAGHSNLGTMVERDACDGERLISDCRARFELIVFEERDMRPD